MRGLGQRLHADPGGRRTRPRRLCGGGPAARPDERIEIYRAPTAETGARAVGGTINVILRERCRSPTTKCASAPAWTAASRRPTSAGRATSSSATSPSAPCRSTAATATLQQHRLRHPHRGRRDRPAHRADHAGRRWSQGRSANLNGNARLRWKLSDTSASTSRPSLPLRKTRAAARPMPRAPASATTTARATAACTTCASTSGQPPAPARRDLGPAPGARPLQDHEQQPPQRPADLCRPLHPAPAGRPQHRPRKTRPASAPNGASRPPRSTSGSPASRANAACARSSAAPSSTACPARPRALWQRSAHATSASPPTRRTNGAPAKQWSVYAGIRYEQIETRADAAGALPETRNTSRVTSPLFHLLWKPEAYPGPGAPQPHPQLPPAQPQRPDRPSEHQRHVSRRPQLPDLCRPRRQPRSQARARHRHRPQPGALDAHWRHRLGHRLRARHPKPDPQPGAAGDRAFGTALRAGSAARATCRARAPWAWSSRSRRGSTNSGTTPRPSCN